MVKKLKLLKKHQLPAKAIAVTSIFNSVGLAVESSCEKIFVVRGNEYYIFDLPNPKKTTK